MRSASARTMSRPLPAGGGGRASPLAANDQRYSSSSCVYLPASSLSAPTRVTQSCARPPGVSLCSRARMIGSLAAVTVTPVLSSSSARGARGGVIEHAASIPSIAGRGHRSAALTRVAMSGLHAGLVAPEEARDALCRIGRQALVLEQLERVRIAQAQPVAADQRLFADLIGVPG